MLRQIEDFDRVLVVEGYSDLRFYAEVLEHVERDSIISIKDFNGKEDLLLKLDALITPTLLAEKMSIGVIVDGNGNPEASSIPCRQT